MNHRFPANMHRKGRKAKETGFITLSGRTDKREGRRAITRSTAL